MRGGPYTAIHYDLTSIGGGSFYMATVTASASGGVPAYKYTWQGLSEQASPTAVYVFATRGDEEKGVTVKDAHGVTKTAEANIDVGTSATQSAFGAATQSVGGAATQSVGGADFAFEVPLGGVQHLIWGEDSAVTASSGDTAIVEVSVDAQAIRISGVGIGRAEVVLNTDAGELRVPVEVR